MHDTSFVLLLGLAHWEAPRVKDCVRRYRERRQTTITLLPLTLLLLLTMTTTVTATTAQTTCSTPQQNSNHSNTTRESSSTTSTYWAGTYGGSSPDLACSVEQASDGGYIIAGYTDSFGAGGYADAWVLKLDCAGSIAWEKMYGGSGWDNAQSIQQTSDGGYIVAGGTDSGAGSHDLWILKLTSDGAVAWQKAYGGSDYDSAECIEQTSDGGYIVAGETRSTSAGYADFWVLKLDSGGSVTWQKVYGGNSWDTACSVRQTSDGGYIVAGETDSFGVDSGDFWVLKLTSDGAVAWQKAYGGGENDEAYSVHETSNGGYIVAGETASFGAGLYDAWVLGLSSDGSVIWQKTYGGGNYDHAHSVQQTSDGGYIVSGCTRSFGQSYYDVWVLKLETTGWVTWQKTYGGSNWDDAYSIQQTSDGGYVMAGFTYSFGAGSGDAWLVKLGVGGDIVWDAGSGASTQTTGVIPMDSDAITSMTSVGRVDSDATVQDTHVTPRDTNATVMVQAAPGSVAYLGGQPTGGLSSVVTILTGVGAVAAVVVIAAIANARTSRKHVQ
jgi:uncharacterized delta-60 repeat protein